MNNRIFQILFLMVAAMILTAASCKDKEGGGDAGNGGTDTTATVDNGNDAGNNDGKGDDGAGDNGAAPLVPERLVNKFEQGEISKCMLNGSEVFHCRLNANDAGSEIFNTDAEKIHVCNAAWGQTPDPECEQLTDCEVLWRVKDNIWGLAPVDNLNGEGGQ